MQIIKNKYYIDIVFYNNLIMTFKKKETQEVSEVIENNEIIKVFNIETVKTEKVAIKNIDFDKHFHINTRESLKGLI